MKDFNRYLTIVVTIDLLCLVGVGFSPPNSAHANEKAKPVKYKTEGQEKVYSLANHKKLRNHLKNGPD